MSRARGERRVPTVCTRRRTAPATTCPSRTISPVSRRCDELVGREQPERRMLPRTSARRPGSNRRPARLGGIQHELVAVPTRAASLGNACWCCLPPARAASYRASGPGRLRLGPVQGRVPGLHQVGGRLDNGGAVAHPVDDGGARRDAGWWVPIDTGSATARSAAPRQRRVGPPASAAQHRQHHQRHRR